MYQPPMAASSSGTRSNAAANMKGELDSTARSVQVLSLITDKAEELKEYLTDVADENDAIVEAVTNGSAQAQVDQRIVQLEAQIREVEANNRRRLEEHAAWKSKKLEDIAEKQQRMAQLRTKVDQHKVQMGNVRESIKTAKRTLKVESEHQMVYEQLFNQFEINLDAETCAEGKPIKSNESVDEDSCNLWECPVVLEKNNIHKD